MHIVDRHAAQRTISEHCGQCTVVVDFQMGMTFLIVDGAVTTMVQEIAKCE